MFIGDVPYEMGYSPHRCVMALGGGQRWNWGSGFDPRTVQPVASCYTGPHLTNGSNRALLQRATLIGHVSVVKVRRSRIYNTQRIGEIKMVYRNLE
jgi:hypothetical protein